MGRCVGVPTMRCTKRQMEGWLQKKKIPFDKAENKKALFAKIELAVYGCPQSSKCGELINTLGHILNSSGTLGGGTRGDPLVKHLVPAIMTSAGTSTVFGGDLKFNAINTGGTSWTGAIVGDENATVEEAKASRHEMLFPAPKADGTIQKGIDSSTADVLMGEGRDVIAALREHFRLMQTDPEAPNYYVSVTQNVEHYNNLLVARDDDNQPIAYYYEPHDRYTPGALGSLPYGLAAAALERILGTRLVYGACGLTHQNNDWLCQTWSVWFAYLLSSGMSYEEAQRFVAEEHIEGLVAFSKFCYTVPFTIFARTRGGGQGRVIFTGSLTEGTLHGKKVRVKDLIMGLPKTYRRLREIGLGDATADPYGNFTFRTENEGWRGGGRYADRAFL